MPKIPVKDWREEPGDEYFMHSGVKGRQNLVEYDVKVIERLAQRGCTLREIAAICGFGESHFRDIRKDHPDVQEAIDRGKANLCRELRETQISVAIQDRNPQMLIFLGKALLEQSDKVEINHNIKAEVEYEISFGDPTHKDKASEASSEAADGSE